MMLSVNESAHTNSTSCDPHHVIYYFKQCQVSVQTRSNHFIVWLTNVCRVMSFNEATMSQWTVSLVTPPQIKCFFQWTQWVGISVRVCLLVNLRFTLTSERLMGRDPGKITLQIQLEFFKSLADTRAAVLARIPQGKGPGSETELELSRQTNQAHIKTPEIIWNHVALIYQLRSNTESQEQQIYLQEPSPSVVSDRSQVISRHSWFDRAADVERSSRHLGISGVSGRIETPLTECAHVHFCMHIHTHMHTWRHIHTIHTCPQIPDAQHCLYLILCWRFKIFRKAKCCALLGAIIFEEMTSCIFIVVCLLRDWTKRIKA